MDFPLSISDEQSYIITNKINIFTMSDGQALALMMMKKRAEGSLDMPVKKKKKKKEKKE